MVMDTDIKAAQADDKAEAFAWAYYSCFNYRKAWIETFGTPANAPGVAAYINRERVKEALEKVRKEVNVSRRITIDEVIDELLAVGFSDVKDAIQEIDADGILHLKPFDQFDSRFIQGVTSGTKGKISTGASFKTHDKIKALEKLANLLQGADGDAAMAAEAFRMGVEIRDKYAPSATQPKDEKPAEEPEALPAQ
jgi:hypothetical protein